jgi:hypothetical protein
MVRSALIKVRSLTNEPPKILSRTFRFVFVKEDGDIYGWQIQETEEPGKGTRLVITIPVNSLNGRENYYILHKHEENT